MPDPVSTLTHLAGALLALVGWGVLLGSAWAEGSVRHGVAFGVYGASLLAMYVASSLYHGVPGSPRLRATLRRLDHVSIFTLIAGSYTPLCMLALHGRWASGMLGAIWALAIAGVFFKLYTMDSHRWLSTALYLGMGWFIVIALRPLAAGMPTGALVLLVTSGVVYTAGALVYALEWPDPWPGRLGFHEIWHLFVLAGSGLHFGAVALLA